MSYDYGKECPLLQDVIDTDDNAYSNYIFAVVATSKELKHFIDDSDDSLPILQRFSIAYKAYIDMLGKQLADVMRPALDNYNRMVKNIDFSGVYKLQEIANRMRPAWLMR